MDMPRLLQSITKTESDSAQPALLYDMNRALTNLQLVYYGIVWYGMVWYGTHYQLAICR